MKEAFLRPDSQCVVTSTSVQDTMPLSYIFLPTSRTQDGDWGVRLLKMVSSVVSSIVHKLLGQYCSYHVAQASNGPQEELSDNFLQHFLNNLTPRLYFAVFSSSGIWYFCYLLPTARLKPPRAKKRFVSHFTLKYDPQKAPWANFPLASFECQNLTLKAFKTNCDVDLDSSILSFRTHCLSPRSKCPTYV